MSGFVLSAGGITGAVTVEQSTAASLKMEPTQTDPTKLVATVYQAGPLAKPDRSVAPTLVNITTVTARSAQLTLDGLYEIRATTDIWYLQGDVTVNAVVDTHHWLPAGHKDQVYVSNATTKGYIAAITNGGTGKLYISKIG